MSSVAAYIGNAFSFWPTSKKNPQEGWFSAKLVLGTIFLIGHLLSIFLVELTYLSEQFQGVANLIFSLSFHLLLGIPLYVRTIKKHSERTKIILYALSLALFIYSTLEWIAGSTPSYYLTSSYIIFIVCLLSSLENKSVRNSLKKIRAIRNLCVPNALKKVGSDFVSVATNDLKKGDIIKVGAEEMIPHDGIIVNGVTSVDESKITGDLKRHPKGTGDYVVGSTLNRDNEILVEVTDDSTINKIISALKNNQKEKIPLYKSVRNYCFGMQFLGLLVAAAIFYYNYIVLDFNLVTVIRSVTATILSFSIASHVPLILISSNNIIGSAFKKGIFFKDVNKLDKIAQLDTLYFDRTGTLTRGKYTYSQSFIEHGINQGKLLSSAFSLEAHTRGAFSTALESHPWYNEIPIYKVRDFKTHPGLGVSGYIQSRSEKEYFAAFGSMRFVKRMQMYISKDMRAKIDELESIGETVILCGYDRKVNGLISLSDNARPGVREMLKSIQSVGIEPGLITSHSEDSLSSLATSLELKKVYARCTPEEKVSKIEKEKTSKNTVGFVGKENNKLCFEKSDVSMTLSTKTNINLSSDILIMGSDVNLISWLVTTIKTVYKRAQFHKKTAFVFSILLAGFSAFHLVTPELVLSFMLILNLIYLRSLTVEA